MRSVGFKERPECCCRQSLPHRLEGVVGEEPGCRQGIAIDEVGQTGDREIGSGGLIDLTEVGSRERLPHAFLGDAIERPAKRGELRTAVIAEIRLECLE